LAYTPFPSDIGNNYSDGFIAENDDEANSEVKLRRNNIANEMWRGYLDYMADTTETGHSDDNFSDLDE
jgi:hypothetical protein